MPSVQRKPLPSASQVHKIVCLMINGIGDILCTTPALAALKRHYPKAQLTVIVRPHLSGLLEGHPMVDRVLPYEVGSRWRRLAYLGRLRREGFDLWVDLHMPTFNTVSSNHRDFMRNALLMMATGARHRLAYASPVLRPFLTHPVPLPSEAALREDNICDVTVDLVDPALRRHHGKFVAISAADRAWAAEALPATDAPRFALFFGSRQPASLWPDARIIEFLESLAQARPQAEWVLIGGPFEAALVKRLQERWEKLAPARIHDFIDRATYGQSAALLERCTAYIGTDSGPMHLADAVGIPIVALFSAKNHPAIWQPISRHSTVLAHVVDCGPCFRADCPNDNHCMALISAEEVLAALDRTLASLPRPGA
ncbi:MAG: glycosyltransferase family 9 protein [Pseudomonadota bacterium]